MTNAPHQVVGQIVLPYVFGREDKITIDGVEYRHERTDAEGHFLRRAKGSFPVEAFSHEQVYDLMTADKIVVLSDWYDASREATRKHTEGKSFRDLPEIQAEAVHFQWQLCERFLRLERSRREVTRSDKAMKPVISEIMAELEKEAKKRAKGKRALTPLGRKFQGPSPATLRRWLRRYINEGCTPDAFIKRHRGPGPRNFLNGDEYELHLKHAQGYASRKKPTKASLHQDLKSEVKELDERRARDGLPPLRILKRRAFERMIDRLDPYCVYRGREGVEAANRRFGMSIGGLEVERPLQRIELDEWQVSLQTLLCEADVWAQLSPKAKRAVERSRVWLSAAIDVRTRVIVAMRFLEGAPSSASAIATLEMVVLDKAHIGQVVGAA